MTLNFIAKTATNNLGHAMQMRDIEGMRNAFENGADLSLLKVSFPGDDTVFTHPFEIGLTCALPLEAFNLLAQHGARMENMEGGFASVEELFESLPNDMSDHWPDVHKVYRFLKEDPLANSPLPLSPQSMTSKLKDSATGVLDQAQAPLKSAQEFGKSATEKVGGFFSKFKKK